MLDQTKRNQPRFSASGASGWGYLALACHPYLSRILVLHRFPLPAYHCFLHHQKQKKSLNYFLRSTIFRWLCKNKLLPRPRPRLHPLQRLLLVFPPSHAVCSLPVCYHLAGCLVAKLMQFAAQQILVVATVICGATRSAQQRARLTQ